MKESVPYYLISFKKLVMLIGKEGLPNLARLILATVVCPRNITVVLG